MDNDGILWRIRYWMNEGAGRWIVAIAALAIVAGAVGWFFRETTNPELKAIRRRGRRVVYFCKACKATGETRISYDTPFPIRCPKCGKVEAVHGFRCVGCGNTIEVQENVVFNCPGCGREYDNRMPPVELPVP